MTRQIDPNKAIVIPPDQHRLKRERPDTPGQQLASRPKEPGSSWEPHNGDSALDEWSLAIRALRKAGKLPE